MAKREFQALRPPLFALALLFCGAAATVMGMTQTAEGAGIRTGNAPASVSAQSTLIFLPGPLRQTGRNPPRRLRRTAGLLQR